MGVEGDLGINGVALRDENNIVPGFFGFGAGKAENGGVLVAMGAGNVSSSGLVRGSCIGARSWEDLAKSAPVTLLSLLKQWPSQRKSALK